MKLSFRHFWLLAPIAAALVVAGCQTSVPPIGAYPAPATAPQYSLVNNFDGNFNSQPATFTNTNLFEINSPTGTDLIASPGTWSAPNNVPTYATETMTIEGPGAAGTALACHITGTVTDPGDGITYPQIVLNGVLDTNNPKYSAYDGSFWTGVKFYVNIAAGDNTTYRYFNIPTTQEAPSGSFPGVGGTCVVAPGNKCYNYFGYSLLGLTPGWHQISVNFSQLTNIATNTQTVPPTLTGLNLQQILVLQWVEGRNNAKGTSNADFWVDEVYFFQ